MARALRLGQLYPPIRQYQSADSGFHVYQQKDQILTKIRSGNAAAKPRRHTVITQQKLRLAGSEHSERAAGITSFREIWITRVILLWNHHIGAIRAITCQWGTLYRENPSYSARSIII